MPVCLTACVCIFYWLYVIVCVYMRLRVCVSPLWFSSVFPCLCLWFCVHLCIWLCVVVLSFCMFFTTVWFYLSLHVYWSDFVCVPVCLTLCDGVSVCVSLLCVFVSLYAFVSDFLLMCVCMWVCFPSLYFCLSLSLSLSLNLFDWRSLCLSVRLCLICVYLCFPLCVFLSLCISV